jgi:hypothetical protein
MAMNHWIDKQKEQADGYSTDQSWMEAESEAKRLASQLG